MPEGVFERSRRATENLKESLPIFLALAILSLSDIDATAANISIALSWLSFCLLYTSPSPRD